MSARNLGIYLRLLAFLVAAYFVYKQNKKTRARLEDEDEDEFLNNNDN